MELDPKKITIEVGTPCNLSCEMCFLAGFKRKQINDAKKPNSFLPFYLFKKIIDDIVDNFSSIKKEMPFSLILTGGEVFLHPNIFDMLSYARKKNIGLTLFTNGTMIDRRLAKIIVENQPEALMFSVDGPEKIHDQIRGSGNFKKTYAAIKLIQEQKKISNLKKPKIFINTLVNDLNVDRFEELLFICDDLKINGLSISHIQWSNPELSKTVLNELQSRLRWSEPLSKMTEAMEHELYVKNNNLDKLLLGINLIKLNHQNKHSFSIKFSPDLTSEEIRLWYSSDVFKIDFCDSPKNWIRIGVNGDIYPVCAPMPFPWGNLSDQSLKEILDDDKKKNFFDEIESGGFFYACHRCCRRPDYSKSKK